MGASPATEFWDEVQRWQADPVAFAVEVLGSSWIDPPCGIDGCTACTPYARRMMEAVRDHRRVAVAGCHASGKTFTAAQIALWWSICFRPSIVVTTAPTAKQVQLLWREMARARANSGYPDLMLGDLSITTQGCAWQMPDPVDDPGLNRDWYMIGMSTKGDSAEAGATRFHGHHARHLLVIFDESPAISRPIWEGARGLLTEPHNHWLALANPTDPASAFAECFRPGSGWETISIDAFDTPNLIHGDGTNPHLVSSLFVDDCRRDWGEGSPMWQAKVRGVHPTSGVDTLISTADLIGAFDRDPPDSSALIPSMGVDVARFGDDLTVIWVIRGGEILEGDWYNGQDTVFTAGRVIELAKKHGITQANASRIAVDDTGLGGGVTDHLRACDWRVTAVNFGERPVGRDDVTNRRTELWFALRDWLRDEATLGGIENRWRRHLEGDLPGTKYRYRPDQKVELEAKKDMKKRLGHSPDHGDALALALAHLTHIPAVVAGFDDEDGDLPVGPRFGFNLAGARDGRPTHRGGRS